MKRNKVIISLIITLVFITGCSNFRYVPEPESKKGKPIPVLTTTVYSGNFSTEEIRGMWMTCSVGFKESAPFYPLDFVWRHCDCYTDHVRKNYKNSDDLKAFPDQFRRSWIVPDHIAVLPFVDGSSPYIHSR